MHNELSQTVLATFGQPLTLNRSNVRSQPITGIIKRDVQPTGSFDAVMLKITTLTVDRNLSLQRDDQVVSGTDSWVVDRRIYDNGYLATWSLHAD